MGGHEGESTGPACVRSEININDGRRCSGRGEGQGLREHKRHWHKARKRTLPRPSVVQRQVCGEVHRQTDRDEGGVNIT